jgi:hypothetical protein
MEDSGFEMVIGTDFRTGDSEVFIFHLFRRNLGLDLMTV